MSNKITRYVLGFIFSPDYRHLILVKKSRGPSNMAGKWNAVGGLIEGGESQKEAMKREGVEESGIPGLVWKKFANIEGDYFECTCFHTTSTNIMISHHREVNGEVLSVCPVEYIQGLSLIPDVMWMMHAAIAHAHDQRNFIQVRRSC